MQADTEVDEQKEIVQAPVRQRLPTTSSLSSNSSVPSYRMYYDFPVSAQALEDVIMSYQTRILQTLHKLDAKISSLNVAIARISQKVQKLSDFA